MLAWIIYYKNAADYNKKYIEFYQEEGKKLGVTVRLVLVEELEFGVEDGRWFIKVSGETAGHPDFAICRAIYPMLTRQLELMGIPVFNNSFVSEICNDKARTYQYLAKTGIKMVDSSFYKNCLVEAALKEEKLDRPMVVKAVDGHGGSQVYLMGKASEIEQLRSENEITEKQITEDQITEDSITGDSIIENRITKSQNLREKTVSKIISGLKSSDAVIQPLTGSRHQDLRVYIIGKEIIAAVLRTAKEGFRSNFSLGGEVRLYQLSQEEKSVVHTIIGQFDFGLAGIDFIIGDQGELIFNEIEDVVGSRMLYQCSDINIVRLYLEYIVRKL